MFYKMIPLATISKSTKESQEMILVERRDWLQTEGNQQWDPEAEFPAEGGREFESKENGDQSKEIHPKILQAEGFQRHKVKFRLAWLWSMW